MGRHIKEGLDYFPMNVDFFDDDKIAFVSSAFGDKGENIAMKLLCKVYRDKGYYYQWGEDEAVLFAKRVLGQPDRYALVNDVVAELVKRDFFDKDIFNRFQILTSKGIQKRYTRICKDAKRNFTIRDEIDLLRKIPVEMPKIPVEIEKTPVESTQRKEKESIVKERKEQQSPEAEDDKLIFQAIKEIIMSDTSTFTNLEFLYKLSEPESKNLAEIFFATKLSTGEYKGLLNESACRKNLTYWIPKSDLYQKLKTHGQPNITSRNSTSAKIITPGKRLSGGY